MDISLYRTIPPEAGNAVFVNSVSLMNVISHEIEDVVINNQLPVDFYAGFQRFSFFLRQVPRYRKLAAVCRRIYVWGVPDVDPPAIPGIEYIPLAPDAELAREWFLVVDTPQFYTALLTREESFGLDLPKDARRFRGIWTYEPELVGRAYLLISQILGRNFAPHNQRLYEHQNRYIVEISNRLVKRQDLVDQAVRRVTLLQHGIAAGSSPLLVLDAMRSVIGASESAAAILGMAVPTVVGQSIEQLAGGVLADLDLSDPAARKQFLSADRAVIDVHPLPITNKYGDVIGYVIVMRGEYAPVILAPENGVDRQMLQRYLAGVNQLLTMMPSLVSRPEVQLRAINQIQRMLDELGDRTQLPSGRVS
ncbi:MAG: hypothetical protein HC822_05620 [Oscillochloris sp.]|nr:hypothetical protein [Oscillochloris sp.]